jgi:hypothetical protein
MSFFPSISQNVSVDTNNSASALTINSGDTWTGADGTSTLGVNAIQIVIQAVQNMEVYVDQGNAHDLFQVTDTYRYIASVGNFGITVQAVGAYVRLRVKNVSLVNDTAVNIDTVLCPIVEALPRSLSETGNLKTQVFGIEDGYGFEVENSPAGEMRTVTPFRLVGAQMDFSGNAGAIDTNFWNAWIDATAGPGSVTVLNSTAILSSGTNALSYSKIASNRRARYVGGNANRFRANIRFTSFVANNTKRWGVANYSNYTFTCTAATFSVGDIYSNNSQQFTVMVAGTGATTLLAFGTGAPSTGNLIKVHGATGSTATIAFSAFTPITNPQDGAFFQMTGTGTFTLEVFKNGTATHVTALNGVYGADYIPDTSNHTWEIYWTNSNVYFVLDSKLLHTYSAAAASWTSTLNHYIFIDNVNSGNTVATSIMLRNAVISRLGPIETESIHKYVAANTTTVLKYGPGRLKQVIFGDPDLAQIITLYDAISAFGTPIATLTNLAATSTHGRAHTVIPFNIPFNIGLTMVTSTVVPVTIIYE